MPTYRVEGRTVAYMWGVTYIEAENEDQAHDKAIEFFESGDATWKYDGMVDESDSGFLDIEVTDSDAP